MCKCTSAVFSTLKIGGFLNKRLFSFSSLWPRLSKVILYLCLKFCIFLIAMCGAFSFSVPETPWCSPIKVKHGYANCRTPQGEYYKNVLGTRCDIRCQKGYELHGPHQLICQSSKRWSGKVLCKRKWLQNLWVWLVLQVQTINSYLPLKLIFGLFLVFFILKVGSMLGYVD